MTRIRHLVTLGAAVAACVAVVLTPAVTRPTGRPSSPGTVAGTSPNTRPFDMPGTVLTGMSYRPQLIVATGESIGTATSADGTTISLVDVLSRNSPATVRVVQGDMASSRVSFDAFTATATDVYFMRSTSNDAGYGTESLWRLSRAGGRPVKVVSNAGEALFQGSVDDLQVAAGQLRWIATAPTDPSRTVLKSMPLPAGPASSQLLDEQYTLTTYPQMFSSQPQHSATPHLTSSVTGHVTTVRLAHPAGAYCDPRWCVTQTSDSTGGSLLQLCHPDGSGLTRLGDRDSSLVTTDPTLLDRFVALTRQSQAMANSLNPTAQLWLYDIAGQRSAQIADAVSNADGAGRWLWWSTGDNVTLTWHALDLSTLR